MKRKNIKVGKRYWFYLNDYDDRYKSGLFTGESDGNGLLIFTTKNGERWHIHESGVYETIPLIETKTRR